VSVLTDEKYFQGSLGLLRAIRDVVTLPLLRKDFILEEYQLWEARAAGADAVLLIVSILSPELLRDLLAAAKVVGLAALVEAHTADEVDVALGAGARILGINNRDLRTFEVDLAVTERLVPLAPDGAVVVGESGVFTRADAARMAEAGAAAVLVGESLILSPDRAGAVRALRADATA
jgi:indole-3-glycerol phosphate synthase